MRKSRKYSLWIYPLICALLFISLLTSYYVASQQRETIQSRAQTATPTQTVLAKNLEIPWALDFLPDGNIIFTERPGRVKVLNPSTGEITQVGTVAVKASGESGLLGVVVHPQFASNSYVYIYYSYAGTGGTQNKVERYTLTNNQLTNGTVLIDGIPGNDYHNGGRMRFGPDGYLYITTGDGNNTANPADTNSLGGKILRVKDDGTAAPGNPFNNLVYSYGHRNPQGIAWDGTTMYETEHGPSQPSCCDEINKIDIGKNYGWPDVTADQTKTGTEPNILNTGQDSNATWAPSGTAFYNGSIFFAGLKGQALYEAEVSGGKATIVAEHFKDQLGRIRDVVVGPDNNLYITTSNKSAQGGSAQAEDDKIIKLTFTDVGVPSTTPSPTTPLISPTYNCLGPCPTVGPSAGTSPTTSAGGEGTPSEEATVDPNQPTISPTADPCLEETASVQHRKHQKKNSGAIGDFMQGILELLIKLLELLQQLLGGDDGDNSDTPEPTPCEPTQGAEEPTETSEPTESEAEPTTGAGITPTTGANPTTGAGSGTPNFMLSKITGYGWPDNSPPGGAISDPDIHQTAGGTGTFEDPITFAAAEAAQDTMVVTKHKWIFG